MNIKWDNLLKKIRSDPEAFMREENGWRAFFSDSDHPNEAEELGSEESDFQEGEEGEVEGEAEGDDDDDFDEDDEYDEDDELESLVPEDGWLIRR